jgi:hypothetical protein
VIQSRDKKDPLAVLVPYVNSQNVGLLKSSVESTIEAPPAAGEMVVASGVITGSERQAAVAAPPQSSSADSGAAAETSSQVAFVVPDDVDLAGLLAGAVTVKLTMEDSASLQAAPQDTLRDLGLALQDAGTMLAAQPAAPVSGRQEATTNVGLSMQTAGITVAEATAPGGHGLAVQNPPIAGTKEPGKVV